MFPISSSGVFEETFVCLDEDKFVQDLLVDYPAISYENNHKIVKKRPRKISEKNEGGSSSSVVKNSANRIIEKQRRQAMAALHVSLRTLLPLEYVKGKRSISDQMQQAVNYINDMKKKIDEMKKKIDNLKKSRLDDENQRSNMAVNIKLFKDGLMEIIISSSLKKEGAPLSKVLAYLLCRQLDVIDCVSTRDARCCFHKIHIKLNNRASIEVSELQEGLVNLVRLV